MLRLVLAVGGLYFQAYGLASDPDDDADINEEVFDWNGEFQVCLVVRVHSLRAARRQFHLALCGTCGVVCDERKCPRGIWRARHIMSSITLARIHSCT